MKISQINNTVSFAGRTTDYNIYEGQSDLQNNSFWHKNSSVDKTLDSYHSNITGKVYFADPLEPVNDKIKESVDFVVYDNEPKYPELDGIRKNYLENNRVDYNKDFKEIRDYYYRREMGGFADMSEAKYQQWQAAECVKLYDKGGDLRYKKETAENEIENLKADKAGYADGIKSTKKELRAQQQIKTKIDKHIANLDKLDRAYSELVSIAQIGAKNESEMYNSADKRVNNVHKNNNLRKELENTAYYNEGMEAYPTDGNKHRIFEDTLATHDDITSLKYKGYKMSLTEREVEHETSQLKETLGKFKTIQANAAQTIADMKAYISDLQTKIKTTDEKIAAKTSFIEDCKAKLAPVFEELKGFYAKRGIKVIK